MPSIAATYEEQQPSARLMTIAQCLAIPLVRVNQATAYQWLLLFNDERLELQSNHEKIGPLTVDFVGGQARHRRLYGGGRGQLIAKACGVKKTLAAPLSVVDLTAGLGRDAFILASLGCQVTMVERSPLMAALLADGLQRLQQEPELAKHIQLSLQQQDASDYLNSLTHKPDVIYIDPMHPPRSKSALVKKEMRLLRSLVGDDNDAAPLLATALAKVNKRVVVKRPRHAPELAGQTPSLVFAGKSTRFDVYLR